MVRTVAALPAPTRRELLYHVQDYLPIVMFLTLAILLFSGYPVAFILGGTAIVFGLIGYFLGVFRLIEFFNFVPRIWGQAAENLVLVSIPTFIFMGVVMERSGIANDLLYCVQVLLKRVPGALALGVTIMGTILAAMTGIIGASVTMMGPVSPTSVMSRNMPSVYDFKAMAISVLAVFTNTVPTGPYRGAGRPESKYIFERLMDQAAREMKIDRVELRRRHLRRRPALRERHRDRRGRQRLRGVHGHAVHRRHHRACGGRHRRAGERRGREDVAHHQRHR